MSATLLLSVSILVTRVIGNAGLAVVQHLAKVHAPPPVGELSIDDPEFLKFDPEHPPWEAEEIEKSFALNASEFSDKLGGSCVADGTLLNLHIMKDGGSSVEFYLDCLCKQVGCGVKLSLGVVQTMLGNGCGKSVCSTHAAFENRTSHCGSAFGSPKHTIVVLRDPVDRAFSYYNWFKSRWPIVAPLQSILEGCYSGSLYSSGGTAWKFCTEFSNHMVQQTFADISMIPGKYPPKSGQLEHAKNNLKKTTVFFTDQLNSFPAKFESAGFLPNGGHCDMGHHEPGNACPSCASEPSPYEKDLLQKLNQADIELYNYARR